MRDPRIDPRAGDVLRIHGTDYRIEFAVVCCDAHGLMVGYRKAHPTGRLDDCVYSRHGISWEHNVRSAVVVHTAEEPAHVG